MTEDRLILDPAKQVEEAMKNNEKATELNERKMDALNHLDELMAKTKDLERTVETVAEDLKKKN